MAGEAKPSLARLGELAQVTGSAKPGFPDRLQLVQEALANRRADIESVELCEPRDELPPLWQQVLDVLEARGAKVSERAVLPARARGDLKSVQTETFNPSLDGSLQLLRPYGPLATAEEVAAWLATPEVLGGTVIIGGDPVLDEALRRHGLPTLGLSGDGSTSALLQVLPLVLQLGWDPPDPQIALDLLTLPLRPFPSVVANRLADALSRWPAVGSPAWGSSLDEGLEMLEDKDLRQTVNERVTGLFDARVKRSEPYPLEELRRRVDLLQVWLQSRVESSDGGSTPWWAPISQCSTLLSLVDRSGLGSLGTAQLERFVQSATQSVDLSPVLNAQAGLARVDRPGAVVGPARRVIWWSFNSGSAPPIPRLPFSRATRDALGAAGIQLPDPGREALRAAERWSRPLTQATEALLLVCPQKGEDGEDLHPHPLWDELVGRHNQAGLDRLQAARPIFTQQPAAKQWSWSPPPHPRREWEVPAELLVWRKVESPSGLASLVGCSFQWALRYGAQLRTGRSVAIPGDAIVLGNLLHEIVEEVLLGKPASQEGARQAALELFDEIVACRAAMLLLPGADSQRDRIRRAAGEAAAHLTRVLADSGLEVQGAEVWLTRPWRDAEIGGRIDLVLGEPAAVLDLKLGGVTGRREDLQNGTAESLAIYSHLLRKGEKDFPPVGFYILTEQALLTVSPERFPGAEAVEGPGPATTWEALDRAAQARRAELAGGSLCAPGIENSLGVVEPLKSELVDGLLVRAAPCKYCDYAALCGLAYVEGAA